MIREPRVRHGDEAGARSLPGPCAGLGAGAVEARMRRMEVFCTYTRRTLLACGLALQILLASPAELLPGRGSTTVREAGRGVVCGLRDAKSPNPKKFQ